MISEGLLFENWFPFKAGDADLHKLWNCVESDKTSHEIWKCFFKSMYTHTIVIVLQNGLKINFT